MSFRRTASGIANLRIFKRVDLVVFTEGGGTNFSKHEAYLGRFHKSSDDIEFWERIFGIFRPNITISCRALGGTDPLKDIAKDIESQNISGVCVVMDRDYNGLLSNLIVHSNVVYTRCYSWESELFHSTIIENSFCKLTGTRTKNTAARSNIKSTIKAIVQDLRGLIRADALLVAAGDPLFKRSGAGGAISTPTRTSPPYVKRTWLRNEIKKKRTCCGKFFFSNQGIRFNIKKHCYGKLLLRAATSILQYTLVKNGFPSLHNKYCEKALLSSFIDWITSHSQSPVGRYYSSRICKISV